MRIDFGSAINAVFCRARRRWFGLGSTLDRNSRVGFKVYCFFGRGHTPSLAADEGLEVDLKFCVHDSLTGFRRRIPEDEVILHWGIQRWRQVRIHLLIMRGVG